METVQSLLNWLLILVPIGAGCRIVVCLIYRAIDEDDTYKKKIRNVLIFTVVAESVSGLLKLIVSYFGGGILY